jgi:formylglycine-generating enzyme
MSVRRLRYALVGVGLACAACLAERAEIVASFGEGGDGSAGEGNAGAPSSGGALSSGGAPSADGGAADAGATAAGTNGGGEGGNDPRAGSAGTSSQGGSSNVGGGSSGSAGAAGAGEPSVFASCAGMQGNECNGESCCAVGKVTGGSATLGSGASTSAASLSTFWLDKYEVTVGRFRAFLDDFQGAPGAGAGEHPLIAASGWKAEWTLPTAGAIKSGLNCHSTLSTWKEPAVDAAHETLPINCLDWYLAFAFCAWDGGRLPTEAEWEYAATGGVDMTPYPWGSATPTPTEYAVYDCKSDGVAGCAATDILGVGSLVKGKSPFGQFDQAGSLWEWTLDVHATYPATCKDCANLATGTQRTIRGGSFFSTFNYISPRYRSPRDPLASTVTEYTGVRCARDL